MLGGSGLLTCDVLSPRRRFSTSGRIGMLPLARAESSWPKCNRLLSLGHPQGAVTLRRWSEWWYVWVWSTRRGLKPKFYKLHRSWSLWGFSPAKENSHGRTGNRTRGLIICSQKLWPPSHEAGRIGEEACLIYIYFYFWAQRLFGSLLIPMHVEFAVPCVVCSNWIGTWRRTSAKLWHKVFIKF
jgi:hypothetical protein